MIELREDEFRYLLLFSFRYALGRMSTAPSTVVDILTEYKANIGTTDLRLFIGEIIEAESRNALGMDSIDKPLWLKLRDVLQEELNRRDICKK